MTTTPSSRATNAYDVVVIGGAISGAATAILLRRRQPHLRVLVVEKSEQFDWKVGESTVELAGYFLVRELKLYDYLSRQQLPKQSFRYWFYNGDVHTLREASEVGPTQLARVPSFQVDRAKLDEHVLGVAACEGAELWRPARVIEIDLAEDTGAAENRLVIERNQQRVEVTCRWVVDATGRAAMIARKKQMLHPLHEHPTAALWARFRNVKDMDSREVTGDDPEDPFVRSTVGARRLATNHFVGYGYWIWFIPLPGGETSVGLVWDKRMVDPPGESPQDKLVRFLEDNPLTRELLEHAEIVPGDTRLYGHLPYLVDRVAGVGWSLVGDAVSFLDPFYSPGLDQMSFSVSATVNLIRQHETCECPKQFANEVALHSKRYTKFIRYLFDTIYRDKYYLMGDYDTLTASFLLDTSIYYNVAIIPVYKWSCDRLLFPPFYQDFSEIAYYPMRFYQRRLIRIAQRKKKLGIYGNHNAGRRPSFVGFTLRSGIQVMFLHGFLRWMKAECCNALTYLVKPRPMKARMPIPPEPGKQKTMVAAAPDLAPTSPA